MSSCRHCDRQKQLPHNDAVLLLPPSTTTHLNNWSYREGITPHEHTKRYVRTLVVQLAEMKEMSRSPDQFVTRNGLGQATRSMRARPLPPVPGHARLPPEIRTRLLEPLPTNNHQISTTKNSIIRTSGDQNHPPPYDVVHYSDHVVRTSGKCSQSWARPGTEYTSACDRAVKPITSLVVEDTDPSPTVSGFSNDDWDRVMIFRTEGREFHGGFAFEDKRSAEWDRPASARINESRPSSVKEMTKSGGAASFFEIDPIDEIDLKTKWRRPRTPKLRVSLNALLRFIPCGGKYAVDVYT